MRIGFRQGIVSHQAGGFLSLNGAGNVDLLADTRPVTLTLADKTNNYLFSEDVSVVNAWAGPFAPATDYWLYWDFDTASFTRTFGAATTAPVAQSNPPTTTRLADAQTQSDYDGVASNGTFVGGDGNSPYLAGDTITLSDQSVVTVTTVNGMGLVTGFTVTASNTNAATASVALTQASTTGNGTGFLVTPGASNITVLAEGQHWFNTTTNEMFVRGTSAWLKVNRVFAARLNSGTFASLSINAPSFIGTQIGATASIRAGRPLRTSNGVLIRRDDGTLFTTEDQFFVDNNVSAIRLESNVFRAKCTEPAMSAFTIVAFSGANEIRTAQYVDSQDTVVAVLLENLTQNAVGTIVPQGVVTNPTWNFTASVGSPLWIDNGALTSVDPHITNAIQNPIAKTPVARVLSSDTIIFEQGLGGVGPRGPRGQVDGIPVATTGDLGAVLLKTAPANAAAPIAVGDNDPRLAGGPFAPFTHSHPATSISFTPSGGITATTVQGAVLQAGVGRALTAGDTFTGPVILAGAPTQPLEAATKQYVDSELLSKADTTHTHVATDIAFSPAGDIAATDMQIAIEELDGDKVNRSGDTITGDLTVQGALAINGLSTFTDVTTHTLGFSSQDDSSVAGDFAVSGSTTLQDLIVNNNLTTSGNIDFGGNLEVSGTSTLTGDVTAGSNVNVAGTMTISTNLNVTNLTTLSGPVTVQNTLGVDSDATFGGTVLLDADPTNALHAATKQYVDTTVQNSVVSELPYDLTFFIAGPAAPVANSTSGLIVSPRTVRLDPGVANVFGRALTPPTTAVTFNIVVEGVTVGTVTFDPAVNSGETPTFNIPTQATINPNDLVELQPATQETDIANVGVTIIGCSTDTTCPV